MKCLWNVTGKQITKFLFLNSATWGIVAAVLGAALKLAGCFSDMGTAELVLLFAGYGAFAVGLIGGEVFVLRHEDESETQETTDEERGAGALRLREH